MDLQIISESALHIIILHNYLTIYGNDVETEPQHDGNKTKVQQAPMFAYEKV